MCIRDRAGGFREEFDGAQDYDFIFRCVENSKEIVRIPKILYHWRTHRQSTADNPASKLYAFEAGKRAIEAHLKLSLIHISVHIIRKFHWEKETRNTVKIRIHFLS